MISEKRKYFRSRVKDDAYAALGNHFTKVGKLKDISIDGLAFRYIGNTEDWVEDSSTIAIFDSESTFYLPNLACKIIYVSPLYVIKNIRYWNYIAPIVPTKKSEVKILNKLYSYPVSVPSFKQAPRLTE